MKKRYIITWLILTLFFGLLVGNSTISKATSTATVNSTVKVRKKKSTKAKVLVKVKKGKTVTVLSKASKWTKVKYKNKKGYVLTKYLSFQEEVCYATEDDLNLRTGATAKASIIIPLKRGTKMYILLKSGSWYKVKVADTSQVGYVYSAYLSSTVPMALPTLDNANFNAWRQKAIAYAKTRLGDKYSQKYRDKKGYADCSSLVRDAYLYATGKYIGVNTDAQYKLMKPYFYKIKSLSEVTPGDLVYHIQSGANHTGIYLGNGQVLHASQSRGKVVITNYGIGTTSYWHYGCNAAAYIGNFK